jgi:hypothetical protein
MHQHTILGERILNAAPALRPVARIVRSTHERWDGTGYPDGLLGADIPPAARIVAVCDAYEAMTSDRAYRRRSATRPACQELRETGGHQFDPQVVDVFLARSPSSPVPGGRRRRRAGAGCSPIACAACSDRRSLRHAPHLPRVPRTAARRRRRRLASHPAST